VIPRFVAVPPGGPSSPGMDGFTMDGFLLRAGDGLVRVLARGTYLDVEEADLLELEELSPPPGLDPGAAIRARVTLRRGCRVHELGDGRALLDQIWSRRAPFAFAARAGEPPHVPPAHFVARERAYVGALDAFERGDA
jgi:hypothetical protein